MQPKDRADVEFAARLVVDGIIDERLMMEIMKAQDEVIRANKPMTIAQICLKKQWITRAEAQLLANLEAPPEDLIAGYRIVRPLGQGGMSRVYEATSAKLKKNVALKILKPNLARRPDVRKNFEREGKWLIALSSENIVKGYELFEADGLVVLAMELVTGKSLLEYIDGGHRFSEDAALYIVLQTAKALMHLYSRGVVHRDIKPANILVTKTNTVKLCDLGLATRAGVEPTTEGVTVGTVAYISPEQALGDAAVDVRSDIYALGVTLYHCVVGEIPFQGSDDQDTMAKRFLESLSSAQLRHVSPHMHYFIQKMMATEKEIRYQSPTELIADIEESIRGKKTLTVNPATADAEDLEIERPFDETEADEKDAKGAKKSAKKTSFRRKPTPFWRDR